MRLSVIINTLNRPATLKQTLAHLARQQAGGAWEVIVVDDGGDVDLRPLAEEFKRALDLRIEHIPHIGIGGARNAGARLARGERLWFVGDDVLASPACWGAHAAEARDEVAVLGPYPQPRRNLSVPLYYWADANHFAEIKDPENAGYYFFLTGNLSLSRSMFEAVGGFDAAYHPYGWEDVDLGLKFDLAGGRIRLDARAAAAHAHPEVTRAGLWRREYWVGYTGRRFYEKWKHLGREKLRPAQFWKEGGETHRRGSWRTKLGALLVGVTDNLMSSSGLNARLFERMVYACRLRGFADGDNAENLRGLPLQTECAAEGGCATT